MYRYFLFYKPFGCVTARRDERHPTVMDRFGGPHIPDLSPVGRLDRETEGLLLLTDDGQLNRRMTRPEFHIEKIYEFIVLGDLDDHKRQALEAGVLLTGDPEPTAPAHITVTGKSTLGEIMPLLHPEIQEKSRHNPMDRAVTFGTITITEGRNRQIRRMMKTQRLLVLALRRVKMGDYVLPEGMKPGEWTEVNERTVQGTGCPAQPGAAKGDNL